MQYAVTMAINGAVDDAIAAAAAEGVEEEASRMVRRLPTPIPPALSSVVPEPEPAITRTVQRRLGSADVERHLRERWLAAVTAEDRETVRRMAEAAIAGGVLDPDAGERIREVIAAA